MACGEKWKQQAQYGGDFIEHARGPLHAGITKREYFAGLAINGLTGESGRYFSPEDMANDAVRLADALLAELERTK